MKEKQKILHIGKSLSGIDTYIRLITKHINTNDFESIIICGKNEIDAEFINNEGEIVKKYELNLKRKFSFLKDIIALIKAIYIIKRERVMLIHAHSSKGGLIGRLAGLFSRIPVIYTPNAYSYLSPNLKLKRAIYLTYEKLFKSITTHLLACSQSEYHRSILEVGYRRNKCSFWKNSIEQINRNGSTKDFFIAIGRPSYQKNTSFLIKVVNILRHQYNINVHLKILGVGHYSPDKDEVIELIKTYNLEENVELVDWCSRKRILDELGKSICYLSSSRYEGLSFSNLEALALGVPIVATDVDGNRDCTIHGETGFLVDKNDIDAFSKYVSNIFIDKKLRNLLSKNSIKYFHENFNITSTIKNLEETYKSFQ